MKALVLDGSLNNDLGTISSILTEELKIHGFDPELIPLKETKVAPCQGCFECWVKSPGECKIDDSGREVARKIVQSDLIIHFTPITFGGYSSEIKKVLDRFIPTISPFFTIRKGETHHKYRYEKRASIIVVGILDAWDDEEVSTFKELVYRNKINMGSPLHEAIVFTKDQNKEDILTGFSNVLKQVEGYV